MNDAKLVSTGKPKTTGAVHWAPLGTEVPDSTSDELSSAYLDLGYLTEDGVAQDRSSNSVKEWGGQDVIVMVDEIFKINLLQSKDINVLKLVFGAENVLVDSQTGEITVKAAADYSQSGVFVFDMIMRGGVPRRIVVPNGSVSEIGGVTYKRNDAIVYPVTIQGNPDADGYCHYEYLGPDTGETGESGE